MWFTADQDATLNIDFIVDGEFVVPSSGSYTLRSFDGSLLLTTPLVATTTSEILVIPAGYNGLTGVYETRFVEINFIADGAAHRQTHSYTLSAFLPLTARPDQVRGVIGLDARELPDRDISIESAYFHLVESQVAAFQSAFLTTGGRARAANEAVVLQAAIDITSSLVLRTMITTRSEDSEVKRTLVIDFDAITARLERRLASMIDTAAETLAGSYTLFELSNPTDAITG